MAQLKSILSFPNTEEPAPDTLTPADLYASVRNQTDALVANLTAEDQMVQSCAEASPAKWHLAHTTWFFETFILSQHMPGYRPFNSIFRDLFNSYYNAVGPQPEKALRNTFSRPGLDEVQKYRRHVDENMQQLLSGNHASDTVLTLAELGRNHEQQHQELLITDIKHGFWSNPLHPAYQANAVSRKAETVAAQKPQTFEGGVAEIGAQGTAFRFDNEAPRHKVFVQPFRFATRLITSGEYLAFMADRAYQRPELWLSEGWQAVQTNRWVAPLYWEKQGNDWFQFTCSGLRRVDENEPVTHVSLFEADAFARWAGARLPTEAEWEIVAASAPVRGNLLESNTFHPQAVSAVDQTHPLQLFGDVWEWTGSAYLPYPGFRPAAGALGEYNGKFMSSQMVLRGGSCVTPHSHIRATYRNFFPPETRWQFSGIRLADDSI
jgi:ergothioneine biosynthesis protein EgtB